MANIIKLDRHVSDLIAAGEVVERPASCVKELIENSIDANAQNITVEIRSGGMGYIRVTDDGDGIEPDDVETAFLRHATSKLRDKYGLEAIATLGFRGEALAAISAVSRVELLSRRKGENEGRRVLVEGGNVLSNEPAGCPEGTTMIIRDLFFNTPARLKFVKSDRSEGSAVTQTVLRIALSHPEISVKYIREGETEFHTPGDGKAESAVYALLGKELAIGFLPVSMSDDIVTVTGFISNPSYVRGNRSNQFFYVNGRYIKSKSLQAALEQSYKNSLFTGRYPACVLYITTSPASVDVNVHPTKTEVKFANEKAVFDAVYYACLGALEAKRENTAPATVQYTAPKKQESKIPPKDTTIFDPKPKNTSFYKTVTSDTYKSTYVNTFKTSVPPVRSERTSYGSNMVLNDFARETYKPKQTHEPTPMQEEKIAEMPKAKDYRIVGEVLDTYIIVEQGQSVWFIDKHAAHERIHFDRLKAQKRELMVQPLLLPIVCTFSPEDSALLLDNAEMLEKLGFSADSFGKNSIAVRQIPSHIDEKDIESTLSEICEKLKNGGSASLDSGFDEILHTVACKAAIKAGKMSDPKELEGIVARVMSGEIRFCPHGRPVAVQYDKNFFDKSFKRI